MLRKFGIIAVLSLMAVAFAAVPALAATTINPAAAPTGTHVQTGTPTCTVNGLTVTCSTYELAGPEVLSYDDIVRTVLRAAGRRRRLLHVPLPVVRASLKLLRFATWEEAELMEEPMVTQRGTADIETLGVDPRSMPAVLNGLRP